MYFSVEPELIIDKRSLKRYYKMGSKRKKVKKGIS